MTIAARTITIINGLLMGAVLDRELIANRLGVELAAADRYILEVAKMHGVRVGRVRRKKFLSWDPNQWAEDRQAVLRKFVAEADARAARKKRK